MKNYLLLALLFSFCAAAPSAFACSPAPGWPPSAAENIAQKDIAFIGTVTAVAQDRSVNGEYRITFEVEKAYKGSLSDSVTVMTHSSSAACGYDDGYEAFARGSIWIIYADGTADDGYRTNSLSLNEKHRSVRAAEAALTDAGILPVTPDEGPVACTLQYAPVCGKDANGTIRTFGNACMLGAEKAEFLYEGECKVSVRSVPTQDLWTGLRNADVTWLQTYLIEKLTGAAARSLESVGATGYFGTLTQAALAEFQAARGISPAAGYFGAITRAFIESELTTPEETETFTGTISAVDTGCFADGICSVTVDEKEVVLLAGLRAVPAPQIGTLTGVDSIGDLEGKIGARAEVYAAKTGEGDAPYTLYGSTAYYVKVLP